MKNHNQLFASQYMQDVAAQSEIKVIRSIHTRVFDSSKQDFISKLFFRDEFWDLAEYTRRIADYSGDSCYFQIEISDLKRFIEQSDDFILCDDTKALLEYCEANKIDYLIHS